MENNIDIGEYKFGIDNNEKYVKHFNKISKKEVKIIFDNDENSDVMSNILKELSTIYVQNVLNIL